MLGGWEEYLRVRGDGVVVVPYSTAREMENPSPSMVHEGRFGR